MPLSPIEIAEFAVFAERLAAAARRETLSRFRSGAAVANKAGAAFDPVTDADREAERAMREMIEAVYPSHGVIGEEFGALRAGAARRWILDPVDGTRAFICGAPSWATLIALEENEKPFLGIIDQPFTDERWTGHSGEAFYSRADDTRQCAASGVASLELARLSTTDPRAGECFDEAEATAFKSLTREVRVARFSLDAYAYGLLALGEIDLVVEAGLKRHDFAALIPVVEGAGGVVTGWRGEPAGDSPRGRVIAAANPSLHAAALARLAID